MIPYNFSALYNAWLFNMSEHRQLRCNIKKSKIKTWNKRVELDFSFMCKINTLLTIVPNTQKCLSFTHVLNLSYRNIVFRSLTGLLGPNAKSVTEASPIMCHLENWCFLMCRGTYGFKCDSYLHTSYSYNPDIILSHGQQITDKTPGL